MKIDEGKWGVGGGRKEEREELRGKRARGKAGV